jgi:hypothetical protein
MKERVLPVLFRAAALSRDQRGQAMAEYSSLTFMILIGAAVGTGFAAPFEGSNMTMVEALYAALQTYINSLYYCLSLYVV